MGAGHIGELQDTGNRTDVDGTPPVHNPFRDGSFAVHFHL